MGVVARASAQEAPLPDSTALPPLPVVSAPTARAPVVRFDDEKPESRTSARLHRATDVCTEPNYGGKVVDRLPVGATVVRVASRADSVLVEFDAPRDGQLGLGWVPVSSLTPSSLVTAEPEPNDGMTSVHLDAPTGVALEMRDDRNWQQVCNAPCDIRVPLEGEYRTRGNGFRPSPAFTLKPMNGHTLVRVDAVWSSDSGGGAGVALIVLGGVVLVVGAVILLVGAGSSLSSSSDSPALVAGAGVMGGAALLVVIGAVVLASRPGTTVTQPKTPPTARLPTWNTGLERTPSGVSVAIPLLSGTF